MGGTGHVLVHSSDADLIELGLARADSELTMPTPNPDEHLMILTTEAPGDRMVTITLLYEEP